MATKASEILQRVQALGYGADIEAEQLKMLNMLHKRVVNERRWRFLTGTDTSITTTVGDGTYSVGSLAETKRIDAVRLETPTASETLLLEYQEPELFRDFEHQYRDNGTPEYWTVIGTELHLWPEPDKEYKVVLDYVARPVEISSVNTEIQIPDSHSDILVWGTVMANTFRERDYEGHNFSRQMYSELLAEMIAQYGMSNRQTAARVQSSGFFEYFDPESQWLI